MTKDINWDLVELYLKAGCRQNKIAEALGIHRETLSYKIKEKYGMDYSAFSTKLQSEGEMLLQAAQFQKALKNSSPGNTQMLMYLGKVRLGQKEHEDTNTDAANQQNLDQTHLIMELEHKNKILEEKVNEYQDKSQAE